ncbi:MAG: OmpA family protein [Planctomycetota bacterium]
MDQNRMSNTPTTAGHLTRGAAILVAAGMLTGCVSQGEYDKLWETNRSLTDRLAAVQGDLESCQARNASLTGSAGGATTTIANLTSENQRLRDQLNQSLSAMQDLESRLGSLELNRLDPSTDRALANMAAQYPELVEYDGDRGMLRFASDLTFGSGSDQLQAGGADALKTLATVLQSSEAANYDVVVVGHTDSERISSNTARRHPTNMHLSAHRAISVRKELGEQGVAWERIQAAGWGQYRPAVPNNARGGTAANRRVEIFLVPSTWTGVDAAESEPAAPAENGGSDRVNIDPTK